MKRKHVYDTKPFDWNKALNAKVRKNDGADATLSDRAREWPTCATGNQCILIPRDSGGDPEDHVLHDLGLDFSEKIDAADWKAAKATLRKIEARSAVLLREIRDEAKRALRILGYTVSKETR